MKLRNVLLLLFVFLMNSCVFFSDLIEWMNKSYISVHIINNSKSEIAFYPYSLLPISLIYGEFYPDTLLPNDNIGYYSKRIPSMKDYYHETVFDSKEIRDEFGEKDSLMFFVFSVDTLNKYSWEEIREDYKILKRYDLSISDLDSLNWTITYP